MLLQRKGRGPFLSYTYPHGFIKFQIIISRINQLGNRPRPPTRVMATHQRAPSVANEHLMTVICAGNGHPTPLPLASSIRAWSTPPDVIKHNYDCHPLTCSRSWILEGWPTQQEKELLSQHLPSQHRHSDIHSSLLHLSWTEVYMMSPTEKEVPKYCPTVVGPVDQEPVLPLVSILFRRACHGSCANPRTEEAVTAPFGISLFSIPRGWMRHPVGRKANSFLFTHPSRSNSNQAYKETPFLWREEVRLRPLSNTDSAVFWTLAQGIPSQMRNDEQIICLPQSTLFLQGMGRKTFSM